MPIQILLIIIVLILIWQLVLRFKRGSIRTLEFTGWLCFWLAAIVVILLPETVSFLARILRVGRGADLVIYLALIILFYLFFRTSIHLEKIERDITKIVRKISFREVDRKNK